MSIEFCRYDLDLIMLWPLTFIMKSECFDAETVYACKMHNFDNPHDIVCLILRKHLVDDLWPIYILTFDLLKENWMFFLQKWPVQVKCIILIPHMMYFEAFFKLTLILLYGQLWPWPLTYIGIVHLAYGAKFVCHVILDHPAKFHAFITIWNIFTIPKLTSYQIRR